jgi:hypothetical protein
MLLLCARHFSTELLGVRVVLLAMLLLLLCARHFSTELLGVRVATSRHPITRAQAFEFELGALVCIVPCKMYCVDNAAGRRTKILRRKAYTTLLFNVYKI